MIPKEVVEKAESILAKGNFSAKDGDEAIVNQKEENIYYAFVRSAKNRPYGHMVINGQDLTFLWANSNITPEALIEKFKRGANASNGNVATGCGCGSNCKCGSNCNCGKDCNCGSKKNLALIIILSIITLGSLAFAGYEFWQNTQKEDIEKPSENTTVVVEQQNCETNLEAAETVSLSEVLELVDVYKPIGHLIAHGSNLFEEGLSEEYKYYVVMNAVNFLDNAELVDKTTGKEVFNFTYESLNEKYHELFGKEGNLIKESPDWCGYPKLNEEQKYVGISGCGDGTSPASRDYYVSNYKVVGDELYIDVAYIVTIHDYEHGTVATTTVEVVGGEERYYTDGTQEIYRVFKDKLPYYRMTFEKDGDHYFLTGIKKTN